MIHGIYARIAVDINSAATERRVAVSVTGHSVARDVSSRYIGNRVSGHAIIPARAVLAGKARLNKDAAAGTTSLVIRNRATGHFENRMVSTIEGAIATDRYATTALESAVIADGATRHAYIGAKVNANASAAATVVFRHPGVRAFHGLVVADLAAIDVDRRLIHGEDAATVHRRVSADDAAVEVYGTVLNEDSAAAIRIPVARAGNPIVLKLGSVLNGQRSLVHVDKRSTIALDAAIDPAKSAV